MEKKLFSASAGSTRWWLPDFTVVPVALQQVPQTHGTLELTEDTSRRCSVQFP